MTDVMCMWSYTAYSTCSRSMTIMAMLPLLYSVGGTVEWGCGLWGPLCYVIHSQWETTCEIPRGNFIFSSMETRGEPSDNWIGILQKVHINNMNKHLVTIRSHILCARSMLHKPGPKSSGSADADKSEQLQCPRPQWLYSSGIKWGP
jgi:hypothetical protein